MATKINVRSPFYIKAQDTDLASAVLKLYISEGSYAQMGSNPNYTIDKAVISGNEYVVFEISELIRDYLDIEFDGNYNDQAVWIRYELDLKNSSGTTLYSEVDLLLGVDGYTYFEQGANVQDNLLSNINELDNWKTKINIGVTDFADYGIFEGFSDASELEAISTGISYIEEDAVTQTKNTTFSIYAQPNSKNHIVLWVNNNYAFFDISNGTVGTIFGNVLDARISPYNNDYYKCEVDVELTSTGLKPCRIYIADVDGNLSNTNLQGSIFVMTPRVESTSAKYEQRDTLLQSNKTIFRLNDHNVRVPVYTRYTTSVAYRYQGVTKRSETISPSQKIGDTTNDLYQIDYISASGSDNVETYEQRVLADGGTLERTPLLDEFLDTTDIGIVDELYVSSDKSTEIIKIKTFDCSKYEPIKVTFVNKFGALQDIFFTLKSTESLNTTGETYKANVMNFNTLTYATYKPQVAQYNKLGKESITLNTNFLTEDYNEVIKELMLSEQVWLTKLTDQELVLSVIPKTQSLIYKTSLNDNLIQYTIDFDYAFDKINTVR